MQEYMDHKKQITGVTTKLVPTPFNMYHTISYTFSM